MSNNFVEHQTLYLNIKLLSITRNISMLWRIVELACGMKAISPKPPKIQTANGTAICWGHDVIECEDCRETITWCSRCVEESSLRLAVKQSQFSEFLLFFALTLSWTTTNKWNIVRGKKGETYRIGSALQQSEMKIIQYSDYAMWWLRGSLHIRWRHTPSRSLFHLRFVFLAVSAR